MNMFEIVTQLMQHKMMVTSLFLTSAVGATLFTGISGEKATLLEGSYNADTQTVATVRVDEIESLFKEKGLRKELQVPTLAPQMASEDSAPVLVVWTDADSFSQEADDKTVNTTGSGNELAPTTDVETTPETQQLETPTSTRETAAPTETQAPPETAAPTETQAPPETEVPTETQAPPETEAPTETQAPSETEAPTETTAPDESGIPMETPPETEAPAPAGSFDSSFAYAVLDIVNSRRADAGLPGLIWNDILAESAGIRAPEIVISWSHTRPDGTPWYTAGAQLQMGENLAYGQTTPEQVVNEWMASPGHAENILRSEYTQMGVSCYIESGTYYWVQHFA